MLDKTLAKVTFADCIKFLSESLDKNVKPLIDGWGKFSLRNLLVDWQNRKHEIIANAQRKGEELLTKKKHLLSSVQDKGNELLQNANEKKDELMSNVHDKGEELLTKKKHIIASVQDKGEELLTKKKHIISSVQDKGEELLTKKKQMLSNVHHTGEHFIEEVLDEAKKKIAVLTPDFDLDIKKPHHDQSGRRKRATDDLEALANLLENEGRNQELNEVDTKMASEGDDYDVPSYPTYITNPASSHSKPALIAAAVESEQYTLTELASLLVQYVRETFSLRRLLRRPTVTSA